MIDFVCSCMCYNLNQSIWKKLYTQNFNFVLYVNFGRKKLFNAKMINLIGEDILLYRDKKLKENEFFFDYKKKDIKPKRKMGHLTILKD